MSNWEIKNAWRKTNGDWVLTVGPGVDAEDAGQVFLGVFVATLMLLEWITTGSFFTALISGPVDLIRIFIGYFDHFWLMVMWTLVTATTLSGVIMKTSWLIKIPSLFAYFWAVDSMLRLAKMS